MPLSQSETLDSVTQKGNDYNGETSSYSPKAGTNGSSRIEDTSMSLSEPVHQFKSFRKMGVEKRYMDWNLNDHIKSMIFEEHFIGSSLKPNVFTSHISGVGGTALLTDIWAGGCVELKTGATSSNSIYIDFDDKFCIGKAMEYVFRFSICSDDLDSCWIRGGLYKDVSNYVLIQTHGVAHQWFIDSKIAGVSHSYAISSDVAVVNQFDHFEIKAAQVGLGWDLYVYQNDEYKLTIPSAEVSGALMQPYFFVQTDENAAHRAYVDYVKINQKEL